MSCGSGQGAAGVWVRARINGLWVSALAEGGEELFLQGVLVGQRAYMLR